MRSKNMEEGYNRIFCDVVPDKGVRIHVEVFVEKWDDAVNLVYQYAKSIKEEYDRVGKDYTQPFGKRGKLYQAELKEATKITERFG
jgi:hypothetical protein